jgi:hypothetical protein
MNKVVELNQNEITLISGCGWNKSSDFSIPTTCMAVFMYSALVTMLYAEYKLARYACMVIKDAAKEPYERVCHQLHDLKENTVAAVQSVVKRSGICGSK